MAERKDRSRILIMHNLVEFSLQRWIGDHPYPGSKDMSFHGTSFGGADAIPGDLVALQSAPPGKWYLGWLIETKRPEGYACDVHTIESIEDGAFCDWSNVGLLYYDRKMVKDHPEWRWTDAQHEFKDRWWRACYKTRDAYIHLPIHPAFDGDSVELGVRVRFSFSSTVIRKTFPNWRKTTIKMMLEFYDAASAELKAEKPAVA